MNPVLFLATFVSLAFGDGGFDQCEDGSDEIALLQQRNRESLLDNVHTSNEWDCYDDCHKRSGPCDKCGNGRVCCRAGQDTTLSACQNLPIPARGDFHVCRDTSTTDLRSKEKNPYLWDCWNSCGQVGGPCGACGPGNRACCRRGQGYHVPICQENDEFANEDFHACLSPAPPPPAPHSYALQGSWENKGQIPSAGSSKTFSVGITRNYGTVETKTIFHEFTVEMSSGFPVGPSISLSATVGQEMSTEISQEFGEETSKEYTANFAPYFKILWEWVIKDTNSDRILASTKFSQTQDLHWGPACLPAQEIESIDDGDGLVHVGNGAQICHYGTRLDGTGGDSGHRSGQCQGRPLIDGNTACPLGWKDNFRGWYDVTGCGAANDYCRWVGSAGSQGDPNFLPLDKPANPATGMWACCLSNGQDVAALDLPGWTTNKAGTWALKDKLDMETVVPNPIPPSKRAWNFKLFEGLPDGSGTAEYIGCFMDDSNRDMEESKGGQANPATNTFKGCRDACGGARYMALQYGGECFCSMQYHHGQHPYIKVPDGQCNMQHEPCASQSFKCGNGWRNAIYEIR